jgi:LuxR family maltose regulon positive regulatory protein
LLPQALLAIDRTSEAHAVLDELIATAETFGQNRVLVKALAVRALALQAAGESSEAAVALERALRLAEPEEFVRSFADLGQPMAALLAQLATSGQTLPVGRSYLATLLAACDQTPTPPQDAELLMDDLSARESEVLRLMAEGAANQEIAETLVVSIHTVKTHVAHILAKLQAANRTQAVARARELRLV